MSVVTAKLMAVIKRYWIPFHCYMSEFHSLFYLLVSRLVNCEGCVPSSFISFLFQFKCPAIKIWLDL